MATNDLPAAIYDYRHGFEPSPPRLLWRESEVARSIGRPLLFGGSILKRACAGFRQSWKA